MAKKTVVTLTDDIDGSKAVETVVFGIDSVLYSIDLSAQHAVELRDRLTAYQEFGTRLGRAHARTSASVSPKRTPSHGDRDRNRDIRRWAEENGIPVKARGKIADGVVAKYNASRWG